MSLIPDKKASETATKLGLVNQGRTAFIELCKQGCDASFLAEHLYFITNDSTVTIAPKNKKRKAYQVSLRSMDDIKLALGGLEKRQITALRKKIKEVLEDVNKLNSSQLIRHIDFEELAPYSAISDLPSLLDYYANAFIVPDALVQNYAPSVQDFQLLPTSSAC